jgi:hypothetical protein
LGAQDRAEGLPQLEPRRLIAVAEASDESCGEGVHHGILILGAASPVFSSPEALIPRRGGTGQVYDTTERRDVQIRAFPDAQTLGIHRRIQANP